jgi:fructose-1,6-bisphosphatase II / sedoheptulose-1,7-bisphosphatase
MRQAETRSEDEIMLNRMLTIEIARVTEAAAIAAATMRGRGDEKQADQLAVDAMRTALNDIDMDGKVVIGEGERDEAPMLYIGEKVGTGTGPRIDIALDPLEGTTLCAKAMPDSLAVIAMAVGGSLLHAPDSYMSKIAIGPGYPEGTIDLDASPEENLNALAKAKGVKTEHLTACVLDRPRHAELIAGIRATGAGVRLISDGDIAGVIHTTDPDNTGIDIYMGVGGAPEGVLAAAALRCIGGQMQGRLVFHKATDRDRALKMGVKDPDAKFDMNEMASGDVLFAASGVTDGSMLAGVKFSKSHITTDTVVMRSATGTVRWIKNRRKVA